MNKYGCLVCATLFAFNIAQAQIDEEIDSTEIVGLDNVVITGQYSAQSVDKSIYKVEVITAEDIKNFAGNTVADVLNQNLNMLIVPSSATGDSQVNIMGFGGEYTKILIDNIPVVGDNGMGVSIDLTKINLDNIERIEIVKGAMGVDYGNSALTGVINIITKKSIQNKWKVNALVQEESVNEEYDWYRNNGATKGKGRHIQGLEISHNISSNWFASVSINRNDFQGYWGKRDGSKVLENRGYEWQPKETWNANGILSYKSKNFKAFYRANYLNESIDYINPEYEEANLGNGTTYVSYDDRDYVTERWIHHLNIDTRLFNQVKFLGDFSYQTQNREFRVYTYDIPNREILNRGNFNTYASSDAFYSRGTFSNFINNDVFNFQIGYELDNTKGFRSKLSGELSSEGGNIIGGSMFDRDINETLGTYAAFASAEIRTYVGLAFRPGFRANFSNRFSNEFNYSLSTMYELSNSTNLRFIIGTTNRFPNFEELFTYFVDSNHDVRGNENLTPENGYTTSIQWNHKLKNGDFSMTNNINTMYLNLEDRIDLAAINFVPLQYQYINIDKYQAWGILTDHSFAYKNINLNLGASLMGYSRRMESNTEVVPEDDFRYTFETNASVNYKVPKWGTVVSAYYKYTGKQTQYVLEDALGSPYYRLGEQEGFSLLDASIRKSFLNDNLELTLGARNILDVTSVNNTTQPGAVHGAGSSETMLFYGRSYFLKLNYTLNFN